MLNLQEKHLAVSILNAADYLETRGIKAILKRRDPKEPGRREKELSEIELDKMVLRMFRAQAKAAKELLESHYPNRKQYGDIPGVVIGAGDPYWEKIFGIVLRAVTGGIDIFADAQTIGMDYTIVNAEAASFARGYVFDEFKVQIEDTTRKVLQDTISEFVETEGMTIGDVMGRLPFGTVRSEMISITEVTRAYANGNQIAGEALKKEFPDVRVIKIWWSSMDERVCDICQPLHGQEVDIDKPFIHPETGEEYFNPPAHVRGRCWTTTTTALAEL